LGSGEWERVRLHAYYSERILASSDVLAPVAALAGTHHERLNGAGYHRGTSGAGLSTGARILSAADVFHAMGEPRPHRPALTADEIRAEMNAMCADGWLDAQAVAAVFEAAGEEAPVLERPGGLTEREVEVLRLIARGATKKTVAEALFISPSTAHTHVVHIYEKLGLNTRAGVALYAMEHGLV
jgi:HD-GYP domain-containing protein (c-di-GMP phosphodiesterase class II)